MLLLWDASGGLAALRAEGFAALGGAAVVGEGVPQVLAVAVTLAVEGLIALHEGPDLLRRQAVVFVQAAVGVALFRRGAKPSLNVQYI